MNGVGSTSGSPFKTLDIPILIQKPYLNNNYFQGNIEEAEDLINIQLQIYQVLFPQKKQLQRLMLRISLTIQVFKKTPQMLTSTIKFVLLK